MEVRRVKGMKSGKSKRTEKTNRKPQSRDTRKATCLVCYYGHSRIIKVQPGRNLPIGDYENIPNPRRVPLDGSQWVSQFFIIFKTAGRNVFILLGLGKTPGAWSHTSPCVSLGLSALSELWQTFKDPILLWNITKTAKDSAQWQQQYRYTAFLEHTFLEKVLRSDSWSLQVILTNGRDWTIRKVPVNSSPFPSSNTATYKSLTT